MTEYVTKRQFLLGGGIVGVVLGVVIVVGFSLILSARRTDGDIRRLTRPSPQEYVKQIRAGYARCAKEPECVQALRRLLGAGPARSTRRGQSSGKREKPARSPRSHRPGTTPGTTEASGETVATQPVPSRPPRTSPRRSPGRPPRTRERTPASPPTSAPQPTTPSGPEPQRPLVDLHLEPLPKVCADGVLGINC